MEEVARGLAKTINRLLEFEDKVTIKLEAGRLADVNMIVWSNECMNKSCGDVSPGGDKVHAGS